MSTPETPESGSAVDATPYVTIVLPCYNEQDHVIDEVERICRAMDDSGYTYELVAVDDCSTDETLARLKEAAPRFPNMRIRAFHRNGGSGTVRRIGTQEARGEIVVWTDADMTYPNERIPELVQILEKDATIDQVVGARTTEEGSHKFLRVPAKWFIRKVAERLAGQKIPDLNSGLRAFRKSVARPYLRLLPPGSPASRRSRCRSCRTSTTSTTCRSSTASGRARRSSASSPTPTATSCRCCGW
nr:hypothetical protein GCM10020093_092640 [Planobispora longispora]